MNHLLLLLICIASVEVFIRLNFLSILDSILKVSKKVLHVIPQDHISDHWKEKVIPQYALKIMKYSLQIFMILFMIFSFFFITNFFYNGFFGFILSFIGIIESLLFGFGYFYLKQLISDE